MKKMKLSDLRKKYDGVKITKFVASSKEMYVKQEGNMIIDAENENGDVLVKKSAEICAIFSLKHVQKISTDESLKTVNFSFGNDFFKIQLK